MKKFRFSTSLFNLAAPAVLAAALALIVVSCAQQSESPVAPSLVRGGSFNTEEPPDPTPTPTPTPPPEGTPCSPGFWKNHESAFQSSCSAAAALPGDAFTTCDQLLEAITCNGGPQTGCTGARRQAAAAALNTVSGCTETD
jgi:hypothetical protein